VTRIDEIAQALADAALDGWLFYDFRMSDPLAYRILGLPQKGITTRRWFCYIPAKGQPQVLVSAVEAHRLDTLSTAVKTVYRSERQMIAGLGSMLKDARRIAMNYSPQCAIPYISRVDAGTIELVRSIGVDIVSAADLIQRFEATLTPAQLAGHRCAASALRQIVDDLRGSRAARTSWTAVHGTPDPAFCAGEDHRAWDAHRRGADRRG
jgi:Xaa-Pro dipeptidase